MKKLDQLVQGEQIKKKKVPIILKQDGSNMEEWFDAGCEGLEKLKVLSASEFEETIKLSKIA